jgi:hypothetical protein
MVVMNQVTQILNQMQRREARAAAELLPLVYDELRGWRRKSWHTKSRGRRWTGQPS